MDVFAIVQRLGAILFPSLLLVNIILVPDAGTNYRFNHSGTNWLGGDGSYPVRLSDGNIAWIFGDSLVKDANGNTHFVHGTILVESPSGSLRLISPGPNLLEPMTPGTIVWPASGFVENGRLQIFGEEISATGPDDFHSTGRRFMYAFTLPDITRIDAPHEVYSGVVSWGHATLVSGGYVYVYGNRELDGWTNTTYLARFKLGGSHGFWQFWDGGMFVDSLFAAQPLKNSMGVQVAKLASVVRLADGRYAAFTIDPFGAAIDVRYAKNPWDLWSAKRNAYNLPSTDTGKSYLPRAIRQGTALRVAYSVPPPTSLIGVRFLRT